MRRALSHSLSRGTFASPSWERPEPRAVPAEKVGSARQARPFLAATLMAGAGVLVVGACFVAARLGGAWGSAAALLGFAGYLLLFAGGLDQLPVNWNSWRERNYKEFHEETQERGDRKQGNQGGKP